MALNVRRLHDIGKSGGYIFPNFIPIISRVWYIVIVATEGEYETNNYGEDPKLDYYDELDDIKKLNQ
ncbi:DUF805 domain-containing protein [Psychroserpens sp.]|uniref:DUF805 domain-containing protein n=1 Tax=Psychroserpens sp. TaxID=2020870 RepID=UPI0039E715CB